MKLALLTSLEASCRDSGLQHLQKHHPGAVVIAYDYLDGNRILRRVGGAASTERTESFLEHGCLGCATKFEILPTVLRLARPEPGQTILLGLPPTWPGHLVLDHLAPPLTALGHRVDTVALAFDPSSIDDQMWDRHTLWESGFNAMAEEARTAGEFLHLESSFADTLIPVEGLSASLLGEQADHLRTGSPEYLRGLELAGQMAPHATLCTHDGELGTHDDWSARQRTLPGYVPDQTNMSKPIYTPEPISLCLTRPLHPQRFRDALPTLAQSCTCLRGRLWVASAPEHQIALNIAGPRVWLESAGRWESQTAHTRIMAIGSEHQQDHLEVLLDACQLSDDELIGGAYPTTDVFTSMTTEGGEQ